MKGAETTIKEQTGRGKKWSRDAPRAKTADRNLTAESRPDCSYSLLSEDREARSLRIHPLLFSDLLLLNCLPSALKVISRSSALKNKPNRHSAECPAVMAATAPLLSLRSPLMRALLYVWLSGGTPDILAKQQKNGNSSGGSETGWSQPNNTPIKRNRTKGTITERISPRDIRDVQILTNKQNF